MLRDQLSTTVSIIPCTFLRHAQIFVQGVLRLHRPFVLYASTPILHPDPTHSKAYAGVLKSFASSGGQ